jgi:hypothetical protein
VEDAADRALTALVTGIPGAAVAAIVVVLYAGGLGNAPAQMDESFREG